jgi:hypothetical protein
VSRDSTWLRHDPATGRITVMLHVQPGAKRSEIVGLHGNALKVRIDAAAVENKANAALVDFLSSLLGLSKSAVTIRRGATSRRKMVEIAGGEEIVKRMKALAASRLTNHDSRITPST